MLKIVSEPAGTLPVLVASGTEHARRRYLEFFAVHM